MSSRLNPPLQRPKPTPAVATPGTKRPSTRRAVLYAVSPVPDKSPATKPSGGTVWTDPTIAAVLIEDHLPARSGYTLPASFGPVFSAGVTEYLPDPKGKWITVSGPYVCDPTTQVGGSWVLVDMDTKTVVAPLQGTSNTMPSQVSMGIGGHVHTGGTDDSGNPMPVTIGTTQHSKKQNKTGPTFSVPPSPFQIFDVGHTSFDASFTFSVNETGPEYNPNDNNDWLAQVLIYVVKQGTSVTQHTRPHTTLPYAEDGNYAPVLTGIHHFRGVGWDVYIAYRDTAHVVTDATFVGTILPPDLTVPPSLFGSPTFVYTDAGNISFDAEFTMQLDAIDNWQREILVYLVRHGGPVPDATTTVHTRLPSSDDGIYDVKLKNVAANVAGGWDVYAAQKDFRSSPSPPVLVATMASNPALISIANEFEGSTINVDGSISNVSGVTSADTYPLQIGQTITSEAKLQAVENTNAYWFVGTVAAGYVVWWNNQGSAPDYKIRVGKVLAGFVTTLATSSAIIPTDANPHNYKLSVQVLGVSNNKLEGSIDGVTLVCTDTSVDMTSGTWGSTPIFYAF